MVRRTKRISVYKPTKHGQRWRIEIRDGVTGRRSRPSFDCEEDAWKAYKDAIEEASRHQESTVGEMIALYQEHQEKKGNKPKSIQTTLYRLTRFFSSQSTEKLHTLTSGRMQALYDLQRESLSVDAHRNALAEVKSFLRWVVKEGYLATNPAENVKGTGRRKKGKMQLRPGEAKTLLERTLEMSSSGSDGALATAMALLMGLRAQEITRRVVRDVDVLTWTLYIDDAKTAAGTRSVEIPELLWKHFEKRIEDKQPADPLFPSRSADGFHHPEWVNDNVKKLCKALGLPLVCAHGLRGSHSTIAREAGATGHLVAKQLGHADERTTEAHYTTPGLGKRQNLKKALRVLQGGRND